MTIFTHNKRYFFIIFFMINDRTADQIFDDQLEPQGQFDVRTLNFCPDAIRAELRMALMLLSSRPEAGIFLDKLGLVDHQPGAHLDKNFKMVFTGDSINCGDVQTMVDDLRSANRLSPTLERFISNLRMQFSGICYYFLKFSELEKGQFNEGVALLNEMETCSKYPIRIYPTIEIFNQWMCNASSFKEAKKIYRFILKTKYIDKDSQKEKPVCAPDEITFDLWFAACNKAKEFKEVHDASKRQNLTRCKSPFGYWCQSCVTCADFQDFFTSVSVDSEFTPELGVFTRWMRDVKTPTEFTCWISAMFKFGLVPDDRMIREIFSKNSTIRQCIKGCLEFRSWLSSHYSDGQYAMAVGSEGWTRFYESAMSKAA